MNAIIRCFNWARSFVLSLIKRSFKTHESIYVSDLGGSLEFYSKLGFRRVMSTRAAEVILIRNHRGDEINLVTRMRDGASDQASTRVLLQVDDLTHQITQLKRWYPNVKEIDSPVSKHIEVADPDGNIVELHMPFEPKQRPPANIYHIASHAELVTGLSEYYYLPPDVDRRFVRARPNSAFMSIACSRIAQEVDAMPLVIEMDAEKLSVEEQLVLESDFDSGRVKDESTYPHVNSPIARTAIVSVGKCVQDNGDFAWPREFHPLSSIV